MALPHQRFTIFTDDDVTPLVGTVDGSGNVTIPTATTDPAGARPYMIRVLEQAKSEIDFVEGKATIGQITVEVLDKRITPADQTTGWFTAILASGAGNSQLNGYRLLVEQQATDGSWYVLLNGVVGDVSLNGENDLVTYRLPVKDMRERERKVALFTASNAQWSMLPEGPVSDYGAIHEVDPKVLIKAVRGYRAKFRRDVSVAWAGKAGLAQITSYNGYDEPSLEYELHIANNVTGMQPNIDNTNQPYAYTYRNAAIRWRTWGSSGAWTLLTNMPVPVGSTFSGWSSPLVGSYSPGGRGNASSTRSFVISTTSGTGLPADNADIEVQLLYNGSPSDDYPLLIDSTFGQLLKDCYDGVYSATNPKIKYDTTIMAALVTNTPRARAIISKSEEDMHEWLQKNWYKPLGYAPALNAQGKIKPIKYAIPDVSAALTQLDNTNLTSANWMHSSKDTVNKIVFKYKREYAVSSDHGQMTRQGYTANGPNTISEQDVEVVFVHASAALLGPKTVEYEPVTVRSRVIQSGDKPVIPNVLDDLGARLGTARKFELFDRFAYGCQRVAAVAKRSDAAVAALTVGDWVLMGATWLPDYVSGIRGINRIMQVMSVQDLDPITRSIELLDAGPYVVPLSLPAIGALTAADSRVYIPITTVPAGTEVRVDFAIATTEPSVNSGVWQLLDRVTSTQTIVTPPMPNGQIVWARARAEGLGKRPSAYTATRNVTTPTFADVDGIVLIVRDKDNPIIQWTAGSGSAGMRIYYQVFPDGTTPVAFTTSSDVVMSAGTFALPITLHQWENILVVVEPWSGWTGSAVSGSAGPTTPLTSKRISQNYVPPTVTLDRSQTLADCTLTIVADDPQFRITSVEFRTKVGNAAFSAWAADASVPYSATATLGASGTTIIEYRVNSLDDQKATVVAQMGSVPFNIGSAGLPECRARMTASDATTYMVTVDALSPNGGTATVGLVAVTGSAALSSGPAAGTYTYASGQVWVFTRGAPLGGAGQAQFRAVQTGFISDDDSVEIPEQGRDTVPLYITATVTAKTATTETVRVTVNDPISQGGSAYITLAVAQFGTGGVSPSTPQSVTNGGFVDYTITRPTGGSGQGRAVWTATATGRVPDTDSVDIPESVTQYVEVKATLTSSTATQQVYTVTGTSPVGTPDVKLVAVSGSASLVSGTAIGTYTASGSSWTFGRGAINAGAGQVQFRAGNIAGQIDDDDFVTIEEQGRDTVPLLMRLKVVTTTDTSVTVRVYVSDPYPQGSNTVTVSHVALGTGTVTVPGTLTITPTNDIDTTGYVEYVIDRPAFRTGTGHVTFKAVASNRTADADDIGIPAVDAVQALFMSLETIGSDAMTVTFRVRFGDSVPQGTDTVFLSYQSNGLGAITPTSGLPTGAVSNSLENYVDVIVTRPGVGSIPGSITFFITAANRSPVSMSSTVDPAGTTGSLTIDSVSADAGTDEVVVAWTDSGFPGGTTFDAVYYHDGYDPVTYTNVTSPDTRTLPDNIALTDHGYVEIRAMNTGIMIANAAQDWGTLDIR